MISEFFIDSGFSVIEGILEKMPDISWDVNTSAWQYLKDYIDMICYLLPLDTITAIISLIIGVTIVRILIAFAGIFKRIIPFI